MEYIYFPGKKDNVICSYGNNIYNLYKRLNEDGEDIASIILTKLLQDKEPGITENTHISDFAEVYLFFDYDNQDQRAKPFVQTFCLKNNEFYAAILLMIAEGKLPSLYTSSGVL